MPLPSSTSCLLNKPPCCTLFSLTTYESQLLRTSCSRSCRQYPQSALSGYLWILACPSDIHKLWYASIPQLVSAVRDFQCKPPCWALSRTTTHESRLLRTTCSRSRRQYLQSGLSPYLQIPACPTNIRASAQASLPSARLLVGAFKVKKYKITY